MKSTIKCSIFLFAFFVTCSLFPDINARPNGINELFTALAPSATGKPGTGQYTLRDYVNDDMKNNLAFLNEICPPLARVADQICQAVQNIVQRCINFFVGGGNVPKADSTTTQTATDSGSTETSAEETTPSSGGSYDNTNPKFGNSNPSSSSESSSESSSSTESSSENSEGETTTLKP